MSARCVSLLLILVSAGGCESRKPVNSQFAAARTALMQGRYDESIETFHAYLQAHPTGSLASRAAFFIAKAILDKAISIKRKNSLSTQ